PAAREDVAIAHEPLRNVDAVRVAAGALGCLLLAEEVAGDAPAADDARERVLGGGAAAPCAAFAALAGLRCLGGLDAIEQDACAADAQCVAGDRHGAALDLQRIGVG